MFLSLFTSMLALMGAIQSYDFNFIDIYTKSPTDTEYSYFSQLDCDNYCVSSFDWAFSDSNIRNTGNPNNIDKHARYRIYGNQGNTLGFFEFWIENPRDTSLRLIPHVEYHGYNNYNLRVGFLWQTNLDSSSVVHTLFDNTFDLSKENILNYTWELENLSSLFTATSSHRQYISISLFPMNEEEYNYSQTYYQQGYYQGVQDGINQGQQEGYQQGYFDGYNEGITLDTNTATIFSGIIDIGLLPVNVFLEMLNLEIFGINIAGFVMGLLSVAIVFILFKTFIGKGGDK